MEFLAGGKAYAIGALAASDAVADADPDAAAGTASRSSYRQDAPACLSTRDMRRYDTSAFADYDTTSLRDA